MFNNKRHIYFKNPTVNLVQVDSGEDSIGLQHTTRFSFALRKRSVLASKRLQIQIRTRSNLDWSVQNILTIGCLDLTNQVPILSKEQYKHYNNIAKLLVGPMHSSYTHLLSKLPENRLPRSIKIDIFYISKDLLQFEPKKKYIMHSCRSIYFFMLKYCRPMINSYCLVSIEVTVIYAKLYSHLSL